jgi:hypothetical protein
MSQILRSVSNGTTNFPLSQEEFEEELRIEQTFGNTEMPQELLKTTTHL